MTVTRCECIIPILRVADLAESLRFYQEDLRFALDWRTAMFASVSWNGRALMLGEGEQGQSGTWVWIGVEDIAPVYAHCLERGLNIVLPPTNYRFAYEMRIADPDGHVLRLGSGPREDLPVVE